MHESIIFCLDVGVDILQKTNEGDTLLHVAAQYADIDTIQLFDELQAC
jgi:ankyrin repeat protein